MTKVDTAFRFTRELTDHDLKSIARVHSVYGILFAKLSADALELQVEYDASRLSLAEVQGILFENGLPIESFSTPQSGKPVTP